MSKPSIGLLGLGYWGKNLLRVFHDLGVLRFASDIDGTVVRERKKEYPEVHFAASMDDLLKNPDVDAVAIATPASTHYDLAKKAIAAGKDVFIEKPLALSVRQGEELVRLAQEHKRILMVGHVLQYHPSIRKLKSMIVEGQLGKLQYLYSNRLNIGKLRTEENILWSFAPHDISVILGLLDEEPVKVSSFGGAYLNDGVSDTTMTTLQFSNGVKGHIFVSWLHPFKEQKLVVVGSEGMAVFDDLSKEKLSLYQHKIEWKKGKIPVAQKADFRFIETQPAEPLKEELQHFIECIQTRRVPLTDGREGLRVLKVLEAADKCIRENRD